MRNILIAAAALLLSTGTMSAQQEALWIRKSCISPDGARIAFCYQGDIFTVNAGGGQALQLTSNAAHETDPLWTPDGQSVIFSSTREGGKDIYKVPANGGTPVRITSCSGSETPLTVTPGGEIIFTAALQQDSEYGDFPRTFQIYKVSQDGGAISPVTSLQMDNISVSADGTVLYEDYKGTEDYFRKHHTSSVTKDIWLCRPSSGMKIDGSSSFTKLSTYIGENRNPVFAADGKTFYFTSEQKGNFNIFKSSIDSPSTQKQITFLPTHPVRNISIAQNGTICFSYNGELYTVREGSEPVKLAITVSKDQIVKEKTRKSVSSSATELAISPNGKEVAVVAHGDVFITSIEYRTTKQITDTPERESNISFSEDGRTIYYDSERNGRWAIYKTTLTDKNEKYFTYSYNIKEERITDPSVTSYQPSVSPDGKWLAYLRDRKDVIVRDLKKGDEKVLLEGKNYSYKDGDQSFSWSPDSRYILCNYMGEGGWNNMDVALLNVEEGTVTNLTQSGYSDEKAKWSLKGKAMTWVSDKNGYRSHGSWGAEDDVFIMFFDGKARYDFNRNKEEVAIEKLMAESSKKAEKKAEKDSVKAEKKAEKMPLDLENRADRILRLTKVSGAIGDFYLTEDGTKLYYTMRLERSTDLCMLEIQSGTIRVVEKGVSGSFYPGPDGKSLYMLSSGVKKIDVATGRSTSISFSHEYEYVPAAEREYIFEHCWNQVKEKFYDPDLHGVDWQAMHDNYVKFLPYIDNNYDFRELLSEMLGELNGSHTGARYSTVTTVSTGHIGVLFDSGYTGEGLRIKEMLPEGMLSIIDPDIKAGDLITAIDNVPIKAGTPWYDAFYMKTGKRIQLTVKKGKDTVNLYITPNSSDQTLLYKRWVKQREKMVEELSGGKVGYVHIKSMDSESFREAYSKILGKYRTCGAVIVDTRHNGGGWLHDDLATLLDGKAYISFEPRGQYIGTEPYNKWTKPSCVLVCEDNYSDASGFPYVYKTLGIGKLIGTPVPGTMTAVWWETQIDSSLIFGIPEVGSIGLKEGRYLENMQIEPDILVYNDPASVLRGEDKQLEAAVAEMLKEIK